MATIIELARIGVRKIKKPGFRGKEHYVIHATISAEMKDPGIAPWAKRILPDGTLSPDTAWVAGNMSDDWVEYKEPKK